MVSNIIANSSLPTHNFSQFRAPSVISAVAIGVLSIGIVTIFTATFTATLLSAGIIAVTAKVIHNLILKNTSVTGSAHVDQNSLPALPIQVNNDSSIAPQVQEIDTEFLSDSESINENPDAKEDLSSEFASINEKLANGDVVSFKNYVLSFVETRCTDLKETGFFTWALPIIEERINSFSEEECLFLHRNFCAIGLFDEIPESGQPAHLPFLLASPVYRAKLNFRGTEEKTPAEFDPKFIADCIHKRKIESRDLESIIQSCRVLDYWQLGSMREFFPEQEIDRSLRKLARIEINARWEKCLAIIEGLADEGLYDTIIERFLRIHLDTKFFNKDGFCWPLNAFDLLCSGGSFYNYLQQYVNVIRVDRKISADQIRSLRKLKESNPKFFSQIHTISFGYDFSSKTFEEVYRIFNAAKRINLKFGGTYSENHIPLYAYTQIVPRELQSQLEINVHTKNKCYYFIDSDTWSYLRMTYETLNHVHLVIRMGINSKQPLYLPHVNGHRPSYRKFNSRAFNNLESWLKNIFKQDSWIFSYS